MKTLIIKFDVLAQGSKDRLGTYSFLIEYESETSFSMIDHFFKKNPFCKRSIWPEDIFMTEEKMHERIHQAIYADMHSFEQRRDERAEMSARD